MRSRLLLFGGALAAVTAAALVNRNKVAGLIGARSSVPEPPPDTPPVASYETPVAPAPDPIIEPVPEDPAVAEAEPAVAGADEQATVEQPQLPTEDSRQGDDATSWQTWSGRPS